MQDGHKIFLIHQVDDFVVSAPTLEIANCFFSCLDDLLLEPIKMQGVIDYFNGINLRQSRYFITVDFQIDLDRVFEQHGWSQIATASLSKSIPILADSTIICELKSALGPTDAATQTALEKEMGFSYCAAISEIIYALIMCLPDISFATTKLSQYSVAPAKCHYVAVKNVFHYPLATKDVGLTYWWTPPLSMTFLTFLLLNQSHQLTSGTSILMAAYTYILSTVL